MKTYSSLLAAILVTGFGFAASAFATTEEQGDYIYNGVTFMSMQASDGDWMDTVWALEVHSSSNNLFDLVVSPTPKRISVRVLTDIDSNEWVEVWNRKLQALDLNSGLEQGEYAKSFKTITQYLPKQLRSDDQFALENKGAKLEISLNGDVLATIDSDKHFSFWMSAWMSASNAGIYADGSMLANGKVDSYLLDLIDGEAPVLDPTLLSAVF